MDSNFGNLLPEISVPPPGPTARAMSEELIKFESPGVSSIASGNIPIFWEEAKGCNVLDSDGNRYLDLSAAFAVCTVGHRNERVSSALKNQIDKLIHGQGAVHPNSIRLEMVRKLAEVTPEGLSKAIILNTGAEAVEIAIKTAILHTRGKGILSFHGSFHGKTTGALAVTSRRSYRNPFQQMVHNTARAPYPYCYRCPFRQTYPKCNLQCLHYTEYLIDNPATGLPDIGTVVLEPIQGHEGWIVPPDDYLPRLRELCDQRGILMIVDEIITGFGRTGSMFAVEHGSVVPDLIVFGKAMSGGFPVSAAVGKPDIMDIWQSNTGESTHSSTFMGHPLGCAAALAGIAEIEERSLVKRAHDLGLYAMEYFQQIQKQHPIIGDVRGKGLMIGLEIVRDPVSKEPSSEFTGLICKKLLKAGIILSSGGTYANVLKLSPPLTISKEQLDHGMEQIESCISEVENKL
jgi:4-aminobutyrate aminotransferase / (S)-3-amino-2-methylpropionate transaminase / 5-aminovalerate transaminase